MLKKFISMLLVVLFCAPVTTSYALMSYGYDGAGGFTDTQNAYFFDVGGTVLVENKESFSRFDYQSLYTGSYLLLPLKVYVGTSSDPVAVTDKMIKNDNLTFSYKVMRGGKYVEPLTVVDGKKLKLPDVSAGSYIMIPFNDDYPLINKTTVSIQFVLAVNGVTYQYTQTTLNCRIQSHVTNIWRNSVYGAKSPVVFTVNSNYAGEASFDFGDGIVYTSKVKNGGKYFLTLSREPNQDIVSMYSGAYLEFYSFRGVQNTFPVTGRLEIPVKVSNLSKKGVAPSLYVYRIDGSTLTSLSTGIVSFNNNTGKLTINTNSLDNYVLSNQPLDRVVASSDQGGILKSGYAPSEPAA